MVKRGKDLNTQIKPTERGLDCVLFFKKKIVIIRGKGLIFT